MQQGIYVPRESMPDLVTLLPGRAKPVGVAAPTVEARAVTGRERSRLIQKEQLGPASSAHHLPAPSLELTQAYKPGHARPAPRQQGPRCGIVNNTAIAGEHSAMWGGNDLT